MVRDLLADDTDQALASEKALPSCRNQQPWKTEHCQGSSLLEDTADELL